MRIETEEPSGESRNLPVAIGTVAATEAVRVEGWRVGKAASTRHPGRESLGQVGPRLRREPQRETDDILPGIKWEQGQRTFRALFSLGS